MKFICFVGFIFVVIGGFSQNSSELPFINHLIDKGYYSEAIYLIESDSLNRTKEQLDSLCYYKGWANYSLKNLEQSTQSLLDVSDESSFYLKSKFFAGSNQIFLENYSEARRIFSQINTRDEPYLSLINFELGGIEMLQGNWLKAKEQLQLVNSEIATINQQFTALGKICDEQESYHPKSPLLAGVMSGIIPGTGKIYAGKTGEGIASMISVTGFGLITLENYKKLGISNLKTILFGSIFIVNYVSNIYGSVISVKIIENEYQNVLHNQVLFQLHIPLRNFF